uniref:Putative transcription activator mbf2 n=1 Tax=Lutzomyia longipalpis TaxID=7200 RepID=A0A7G3AZV4_LUTLO
MNRLVFLLVVVCAAGFVLSDAEDVSAKIRIVDSISDFKLANPDVQLMKLDSQSVRAGKTIHYSLGGRVAGDRLVGTSRGSHSWAFPQNIQLSLNYPTNGGSGAVVTYVSIHVNQTSNQGRGYVLNGGIGQRFISIIIEANNTLNFSYNAEIYGV